MWPPLKKVWGPLFYKMEFFYDAVARIVEIPMTDLSAISARLQLKSISDRELHFLKEYCAIMKPLTVALDILQGEDNCYFGSLLPTLETLKSKTLEVKDSLTVATGLPEAIVQVRNIFIWFSLITIKTAFNQWTQHHSCLLQHTCYNCLLKEKFILTILFARLIHFLWLY